MKKYMYNVSGKNYDTIPCKESCILNEIKDLDLQGDVPVIDLKDTSNVFFKIRFFIGNLCRKWKSKYYFCKLRRKMKNNDKM